MIKRIHDSLKKSDVAKLSANRTKGTGWKDLLEDLLLWHVARFVFDDIPIPYLTHEEADRAFGYGGSVLDAPVPGCIALSQEGKPPCYIAPPEGATLRVTHDNKVEAVWPDGRTKIIVQVREAVDPSGAQANEDEMAAFQKLLDKNKRASAKAANLPLHEMAQNRACKSCGKAYGPMKKCSSCGVAYYCSIECQKRDWSKGGHKAACADLKREKDSAAVAGAGMTGTVVEADSVTSDPTPVAD
ncbi:hypothetical protein CEUSTIGMA_g1157.t1 [Chlamydomonas eustigma]|uniref:MYND-type domain-containing protein n=1 Tax=Chlamydomonas eustigma TaxID=1157962 RepID=A0A250WS94_9CHLO|nr:hypothetical protein CEUSTIGMA_g1157.t1 [Chlamydomonas eustigma]|eukprot:GAX73705.1 hypothetical protein CEUSTIGMA_g1157.t1 [Chlamydomonas eustigma]